MSYSHEPCSALYFPNWPQMTRTILNDSQLIQFVQKSKTCKWWNEFMNQFQTSRCKNKHGPNSKFGNSLSIKANVDISFVKLSGFIFSSDLFISRIHENSFGKFSIASSFNLSFEWTWVCFPWKWFKFFKSLVWLRHSQQDVAYYSCCCHHNWKPNAKYSLWLPK